MSEQQRRKYNNLWANYTHPNLSVRAGRELWILICEIAACGHNPTPHYVQPSVIAWPKGGEE